MRQSDRVMDKFALPSDSMVCLVIFTPLNVNLAPENLPSQRENIFPTIIFQGLSPTIYVFIYPINHLLTYGFCVEKKTAFSPAPNFLGRKKNLGGSPMPLFAEFSQRLLRPLDRPVVFFFSGC